MLGASAAYHLARAGMRPLVIEANSPAWGASGRNAGMAMAGVGDHFERVTALVQESGGRSILDYTMRSLDMLEAWDAELPDGIEWDRFGSLDLATDEDEEERIRRTAWLQAGEGLEVRIVSGAELDDLAPGLAPGTVRSAKWTPQDANLNPFRLCFALLDAVRAAGGTVVTGVRVDRLRATGGRLTGLATSHGRGRDRSRPPRHERLDAGAGAAPGREPDADSRDGVRDRDASVQHRQAGIRDEPVQRVLAPDADRRGRHRRIRGRRRGDGHRLVLDARAAPACRHGPAGLLAALHPQLAEARIARCWAGLLDFASLEMPMAGPLPAQDGTPLPGAYVAAGLTGHGLPYAPILGLLLSELISTGRPQTLPLAPFDPMRYVGAAHPPTWLGPSHGNAALPR